MEVTIEIKGTAPLLMHNIRLANPRDPIARAMKEISSKRKKTDDDHEKLARLEFEGGLYLNDHGPFIPGVNVEKCIVEGARITKQGKQVERGLFVTDTEIPLIYPGPRSVDALWSDPEYVSTAAVKVGTSRVMRTRPMFRNWAIEVHAQVGEDFLNLSTLESIVEDAGRSVGLGDNRPRFGRFEAKIEKV